MFKLNTVNSLVVYMLIRMPDVKMLSSSRSGSRQSKDEMALSCP